MCIFCCILLHCRIVLGLHQSTSHGAGWDWCVKMGDQWHSGGFHLYLSKLAFIPDKNTLAANLMARAWNLSTELHTVTTEISFQD